MSKQYALEAEGLGKAYRIYHGPAQRIGEALSFGKFKGHHAFWALRDINFKLLPGASLGLCGSNGAGKSTMLKVLSGTTAPTEGRYRSSGRVASLLELGAGFHQDFTGRANIVMNAMMMGLSRREVEQKMGEIIDFAELGSYIDEPVRTYSSGMGLRLGFSVAIAVNPAVMIIDEVFAVGDMYFQKKCIDKIYQFKKAGKTIMFCSHSLYDVRQFCDEAIWLDKGECKAIGDSVEVTNEYSTYQRHHIGENDLSDEEFKKDGTLIASGDDLPFVRDARVYRMGTEEECYHFKTGDSIEIRIWWSNPNPERTPINLAVGFTRHDMTTCSGAATHLSGHKLSGKEGCLTLSVPDIQLLSGQFLLPVYLFDEVGVHRYQEYMVPENLVIQTNTRDVGLFRLDTRFADTDHALPQEPTEDSELPAAGDAEGAPA